MQITLRAARMNIPLTQKEAAEHIGVTVDTIGNWERGKSFPDALQIKKLRKSIVCGTTTLFFCRRKRFKRKRESEVRTNAHQQKNPPTVVGR